MNDELSRWRAGQARRWMDHVRATGRSIESMREEVEMLKGMMLRKGIAYRAEPGSPNAYGDAIPDGVASLQEAVSRYSSELSGYLEELQEAHDAIGRVMRPELREALRRYYLNGDSWEQCCVSMGYTWDGMMKLRRRALCAVYEFMPMRWRDRMEPAL